MRKRSVYARGYSLVLFLLRFKNTLQFTLLFQRWYHTYNENLPKPFDMNIICI